MINFNYFNDKSIDEQAEEQGYKIVGMNNLIKTTSIKDSFKTLLHYGCLKGGTIQVMVIDSINREINEMLVKDGGIDD